MRLTTKGRFAVTAMLDLALRHQQGPVTLAGIGQRQGISLSYLEQLFGKLRRHELVESVRGPGGGYRLAREAQNISALEAIRVIDGPIILTKCFTEHAGCDQTALCPVREPLRKVHEGILSLLANISLADLASEEMQIPSVRPPLQNIQLTRLSGTT